MVLILPFAIRGSVGPIHVIGVGGLTGAGQDIFLLGYPAIDDL